MGNLMCEPHEAAHLTAVARDLCPFPDYSPSPLLNILAANSSALLREKYATVQASLTPQQQQDFTRSLRNTFGREGKVSHGGMGIVALSLAVLFDTVAREVKGEHVSDQEPIPGLFLKDPRGTHSPLVYTISKYLRLLPYIANNPTRMTDETEKFLHEFNQKAKAMDVNTQLQDITILNIVICTGLAKTMDDHLKRVTNRTIGVEDVTAREINGNVTLQLNCDPNEASKRFMAQLDSLDSFGNRTKEAYEKCGVSALDLDKTVMENMVTFEMSRVGWSKLFGIFGETMVSETKDFDLKANALGKWA